MLSVPEPVVEELPPMPDLSDPNKMMSPDEIEALLANMSAESAVVADESAEVIGPLLDCCTLFTVSTRLSWKYAATVFGAGLPYNLQHGLACGVTLLLFSRPLLEKLDRLKTKYGMMDARREE